MAYFLGTHGPSVTLETACSSSMVAVTVAVNSLLIGDCDIAIVVGNNSFGQKDFQLSLQACGVLVEGPTSHPFDQDVSHRLEDFTCLVMVSRADGYQGGARLTTYQSTCIRFLFSDRARRGFCAVKALVPSC